MTSSRIYGPHNLTSSSLCFGTMQFGAGASETDSAEMYQDCRAAGINFLILPMSIQTANQNSFWAV